MEGNKLEMARSRKPKISKAEKLDLDKDVASRQKMIKGWRQGRLRKTSILVAGAGALGNEIVKNLVMLGIGTIYIIDFDEVVKANLNRCIFFRLSDTENGRKKVKAIAKRAKELDPYGYITITPIVDEIGPKGIYYQHPIFDKKKIDLIFGAVDNDITRIYLSIISLFHNIPYIDGAMLGLTGNVFTMIPPSSSCYGCVLSDTSLVEIMRRFKCPEMRGVIDRKVPSLPTTTSIISAIQVQEALKIILNPNSKDEESLGKPSPGKMISVNLATNDWFVYNVPKKQGCPACSYYVR